MYRSKTTSSELDFFHFWQPFVRSFQLLGISHYAILRPDLSSQRVKLNFLRIFFAIVTFTQLTGFNYFLVAFSRHMQVLKRLDVSVIFILVATAIRFCQFFAFVMIPFETFFRRRAEMELFETLRRIDQVFRNSLKSNIDYRAHRRQQMRKICLFFLGMISITGFSFALGDPFHMPSSLLGRLYLVYILFLLRIRVFQFAFYINVLNNLLADLKMVMRRQQLRTKYNPTLWKDIRFARKIYTNIWLLKSLIGKCFGFSMILFMADSGVQLINSAYWFYLNNTAIHSVQLDFRKYLPRMWDDRTLIFVFSTAPANFSLQKTFSIPLRLEWLSFTFAGYRINAEKRWDRSNDLFRGVSHVSVWQGKEIATVLHSHQNFRIDNYQRFVRIFSLHIQQQPIDITATNFLTINNALMNSV